MLGQGNKFKALEPRTLGQARCKPKRNARGTGNSNIADEARYYVRFQYKRASFN